ncbi:MAG TPA: rhamnulokinase family protein [Acidimicrobiales bacterium]|jgi:rhamnulokinase|nr:rhamnulokinase family protein [Acidimicrobiales bacterium]
MAGPGLVAVDLGASSGRVVAAQVEDGALQVEEVARFANRPVAVGDHLYWDILGLWQALLDGLRMAGRRQPIASIGVDSWAVDYGLLDSDGDLLANPFHYRDRRTDGVLDRLRPLASEAELYGRTGIAMLPFNTAFQLLSSNAGAAPSAAATLLLIPDLIGYWLTGETGAEVTNASTTGLLSAHRVSWDSELMDKLGIRSGIFAGLRFPGERLGVLTPTALAGAGLAGDVAVTTVASHDTASAVVAVPATTDRFAYISCGTWSLVGLELSRPVLDDAARLGRFTNERGVDGTVRFLRNVTGMWLLQEAVRAWEADGARVDLGALVESAGRLPALRSVIDADDAGLLFPGDVAARVRRRCRATGQPIPEDRAAVVRCVLDSLAVAHRRAVRDACELTHRAVDVVHMVGGGSRNGLLCQLTADACGLPVVAGPAEASAIGNLLVQARAAGLVGGDLGSLRSLVAGRADLRTYIPSGGGDWDEAEARAVSTIGTVQP